MDKSVVYSFLLPYSNTNYNSFAIGSDTALNDKYGPTLTLVKSVTNIKVYNNGYGSGAVNWAAFGYIDLSTFQSLNS